MEWMLHVCRKVLLVPCSNVRGSGYDMLECERQWVWHAWMWEAVGMTCLNVRGSGYDMLECERQWVWVGMTCLNVRGSGYDMLECERQWVWHAWMWEAVGMTCLNVRGSGYEWVWHAWMWEAVGMTVDHEPKRPNYLANGKGISSKYPSQFGGTKSSVCMASIAGGGAQRW